MSKTIAAVVTKMVSELEGLKTDEERERAFAGARAVLGMGGALPANQGGTPPTVDGAAIAGISSAGMAWLRRAGLTKDKVEEYLHIDEGRVTLLGPAMGKGKREQSINTYLLTGVASLLETGKAEFSDQTARDNCTQLGCYDSANHAGTIGQFGNRVTGSKSAGWKLTAPGLVAAAALLNPQHTERTT